MFCNWLSKKEGFQEFYIFKGNKLISVNKTSNGYRLPTEAEWEYISKSNLKSLQFIIGVIIEKLQSWLVILLTKAPHPY